MSFQGDSKGFRAQHGEDCLLWEFFNGRTDGTYVDVGAFDGLYISNTAVFDQAGWTGICVEANPKYADMCRENRPDAVTVHAACVGPDAPETVTLNIEPLGLLARVDAGAEWRQSVQERYERRGLEFHGGSSITVPAMTLNAIIDAHPKAVRAPIDILSVDVEGLELEVLAGFDIEKWRPRVIILEAGEDEERSSLAEYLAPFGYVPARQMKVNTLFARAGEDAERLAALSFGCVITPQRHPQGEEFDLVDIVEGKPVCSRDDALIADTDSLRQINRNVLQRLEARNEEIAQLKAQLESAQEKLAGRTAEVGQQGAIIASVQDKLAGRNAEVDKQRALIESMQQKLSERTAEVAELKTLLATAQKKLISRDGERSDMKTMVGSVQEKLARRNEEVAELKRILDSLSARHELAESNSATMAERMQELNEHIESAIRERDEIISSRAYRISQRMLRMLGGKDTNTR